MLSGFFVTKKGKNLLAKTHDGAHIQLTRAEIGNGDVPEDQLVTDVTQLYGKIKELPLRDVKIIANDTACVPVQFSNKGVLTSFELKEVGIYALDPDEGEILYLYSNTSATGDKPDEIKGESEAPLEYLFNLNLTFDNGKDVKVTVDNGIIYATVQELLDMADTKVDKVDGKGLSAEDYTTAEKNKLAGIEAGANKYVHPATHPVGIITGLGTAATKDVGRFAGNVVGVNPDGKIDSTLIGRLAHVGTDGYIAYPGGGQLNSRVNTQTGMLKITLPVSWATTMLKFKVNIYNYNDNTSVDYIISGYSYKSDVGWTQTTAYCVSPWGTKLANLPVSFGHDGAKCAITIGTPTTVWNYPQVVISDVTVAFEHTKYGMWKSGWSLSFVAEALPTVNTTITNTNITYNVNRSDSAAKADKVSNKLTAGSKTYDGSSAVTLTAADIPLAEGSSVQAIIESLAGSISIFGSAVAYNVGTAEGDIPVLGTGGKLATGTLSPDPGAYKMNPILGPSSVLHVSLNEPTLAEIGAIDSTFTNKIAFYPYEYALCEISSDGGVTWTTDPDMTEAKWKSLMSENNNANVKFSIDTQYRITISARSYCRISSTYFCASMVYRSKLGVIIEGCNNADNTWSVLIQKTNSEYGAPSNFWVQHSAINFRTNLTTAISYSKVRITFIPEKDNSSVTGNIELRGLRWYGGFPNTDHRTIYSWDGDKNVTFPAQLSAPNMLVDNILQVGRTFYNVLDLSIPQYVREIVIYTKIPLINRMISLYITGYEYNSKSAVDIKIGYNYFTTENRYRQYGATSSCGWRPDIYLFAYTGDDGKEYTAIGLQVLSKPNIYYPRLTMTMYDQWNDSDDYSKGWTTAYVLSDAAEGETLILDNHKVQVPYLEVSGGGSGTGQTWHAKDILGSGTTSTVDATAESGYSVIIDTTAKNLNGSTKKYNVPFGTYVAIFRVQTSTITDSADKVKLEIWGASAAIANRTVKLSDFSTTSDWEYFKIPFVTKSTTGREIYPKVTCLNATGSIKVDTIVVLPNAFALM